MISCKKLLLGIAGVSLAWGSVCGYAADDKTGANDKLAFVSNIAAGQNVVLFKIHDIVPIKNDTGEVMDCEFGLTLYNRSPKTIKAATLNLQWIDRGIADIIDMEAKLEAAEAEKVPSLQENRQPKTENFTSKDLSTSIVLPQIKPFRQVSLKSRINSDRCFLMLENVDYSFDACNVVEESDADSQKNFTVADTSSEGDCKALFRFVSPKDPEYYREFQQVSFNEEAEKQVQTRKKDMDEITAKYDEIMQQAKSIVGTLEAIQ